MREVKMYGYVVGETTVKTVGDLRELIEWCDKYRVPDSVGLDWASAGGGSLYLELSGENAPAVMIECGDHIPPDTAYNLLLDAHTHEEES
jgi:hypothetical protein